MIEIFIPFNVPSSKNNKMWTGRFLVNSKLTQSYIKQTQKIFRNFSEIFRARLQELHQPYTVEFTFVRDSKRRFDYVNPLQTIQDIMTSCLCEDKKACPKYKNKVGKCAHQWIDDDNADVLLPKLAPYQYDKASPGVIIRA